MLAEEMECHSVWVGTYLRRVTDESGTLPNSLCVYLLTFVTVSKLRAADGQ